MPITPAGELPPPYQSPYGKLDAGLPARLDRHLTEMATFGRYMSPGLGFFEDIRAMITLLNSREWLEWVRLHGPDRQRDFAGELLATLDTADDIAQAADEARGHDLGDWPDPQAAIEALDAKALAGDRLAQALVDAGDALGIPPTASGVGLTPHDVVEELTHRAIGLDNLRDVLVGTGALAADDTETRLPDLLRALLA